MRSQVRVLALASAVVLFGSICQSATITGTVKGVDGVPFEGAFVAAQNTKTKITVDVLSDKQGALQDRKLADWRLPAWPSGPSAFKPILARESASRRIRTPLSTSR
jgi:hypothetical protein